MKKLITTLSFILLCGLSTYASADNAMIVDIDSDDGEVTLTLDDGYTCNSLVDDGSINEGDDVTYSQSTGYMYDMDTDVEFNCQ